MVDASDSKSDTGNSVGVQVPSSAPQSFSDIMRKLIIALAVLVAGCSASVEAPPNEPPVAFERVEVFLARAALGATYFEQYQLLPDRLFHECGRIQNGRFVADTQGVTSLTEETRADLSPTLAKAIIALKGTPPRLEEPGDNDSLFDSGQFTLTVQLPGEEQSLKTSLDEIANANSSYQRAMKAFTEQLRMSANSDLCGKKSFFGFDPVRK